MAPNFFTDKMLLAKALPASLRILPAWSISDREDAVKAPPFAGRIVFDKVSFQYDRKTWALADVDLTIEAGESVAIVGQTGAGKSTLVSLIPRFYAPDSGVILLDDEPVANLTLKNLRQHLAIVTQDVTLFNDTVANNIAFGAMQDSTDAEIKAAAERAYAWPFIKELERGLDTMGQSSDHNCLSAICLSRTKSGVANWAGHC